MPKNYESPNKKPPAPAPAMGNPMGGMQRQSPPSAKSGPTIPAQAPGLVPPARPFDGFTPPGIGTRYPGAGRYPF